MVARAGFLHSPQSPGMQALQRHRLAPARRRVSNVTPCAFSLRRPQQYSERVLRCAYRSVSGRAIARKSDIISSAPVGRRTLNSEVLHDGVRNNPPQQFCSAYPSTSCNSDV